MPKPSIPMLALLCATAAPTAFAAPIHGLDEATRIPDDYIVVLHETGPHAAQAQDLVEEWRRQYKAEVAAVYTAVLNGMNLKADAATIAAIAADPRVAYVEANQRGVIGEGETMHLAGYAPDYTVPTASWGLDRIDERDRPLDGEYTLAYNGSNVHVYVVDTGISPIAAEFGARVTGGRTYINDGRGTADCHHHGTFIAGIVGGSNVGVAKLAQLHPLRVGGCDASFERAHLISALDWIRNNHVKPAVVNLSIGARWFIGSLEDAVNRLIDAGVTVVGASGNNNANECGYLFPSTVPRVIIVGAVNTLDQKAWFSNLGACVDVHAPGEWVESIDHNGQSGYAAGTSFAAPYVTGVAALYLSDRSHPSTPADVGAYIAATATLDVLGGIADGHPTNRLVYSLLDRPERLDPDVTRMPNNIRVASEHCRGLNTVSWEPPDQAGPFIYELYLSAYADFHSSYLEYSGPLTTRLISIPVGTTRYVRVRAIRSGDAPSYYLTSGSPATSIGGCE